MIEYKVMAGSTLLDTRPETSAIEFLKQAITNKIALDNGGAFVIEGFSEIHRGFDSYWACNVISFDCLYKVIK